MVTILFMFFFGRWGIGEVGWYGNDHVRKKIKERESKYLKWAILIDIAIFLQIKDIIIIKF